MSNCIDVVTFNKDRIRLEMKFDGDDYETANVKFRLIGYGDNGKILHGQIEESVSIPVRMIFDMSYLLGMCVRRTAAQYEKEVQEMIDAIELKKHPFKHIGGISDKKDQKTVK